MKLVISKFIKLSLFLLLLFFTFLSCIKDKTSEIDLSNIEVETIVKRFDQKFYTTAPEKLGELKSEFPYLFPKSNPDSVWINKMKNKDEQELFLESQKLYSDFSSKKSELNSLFKHIKYYYPNFYEPKIITILTNVDYENNVVLADSLLFISLDIFLGKDNQVYNEFPNYVKQNYTKEHLIVAVAEKFVKHFIPPSSNNNLIGKMIQEGKKLALAEAFLPNVKKMKS
ncbi:MAG: hypothetical protein L3J08_04985 [Flavobacteriaceae bacterium]|nr:hypothetical protein [Flavobacteriaceae bacterium]